MTEDDIEIIFEPRKAVTAGDIAEGIAKLAQEKLDIKNLRDMFAANAMQGMLTNGEYWGRHNDGSLPLPDVLMETAYEIADAMLKARETKNTGK